MHMEYLWITIIFSLFSWTQQIEEPDAINYLAQFGYLPSIKAESGTLISQDTLTKAIMEFQQFGGLEETGKLDKETKELMITPRCGFKDKNNVVQNRKKRSTRSRWRVKNLNYRVSKYSKKVDEKKVNKEFDKAFKVWSQYTDLKFAKKDGKVHIDIRFEKNDHGDGDPFDGPGGILAHATFPIYGGDVHFDDSEHWTFDSHRGTNLFQVAAHEFGHALGLDHSKNKGALMAPFYRGYEPNFKLHSDDIKQIQALYGKKTSKSKAETLEPPPEEEKSDTTLCTNEKIQIDTIFNTADYETFVFKCDKYWKLIEDSIAPGYPKMISSRWKELTSDIDTAFTHVNGKTYFFKGTKFWKYVGQTLEENYPKNISVGFPGIPDNVDSVLYSTVTKKIYFFKDAKYWCFEPLGKPQVKSIYPKPISDWGGIPQNIDAAYQDFNNDIFFFKHGQYWRVDESNMKLAKANPSYPRKIGAIWFGC